MSRLSGKVGKNSPPAGAPHRNGPKDEATEPAESKAVGLSAAAANQPQRPRSHPQQSPHPTNAAASQTASAARPADWSDRNSTTSASRPDQSPTNAIGASATRAHPPLGAVLTQQPLRHQEKPYWQPRGWDRSAAIPLPSTTAQPRHGHRSGAAPDRDCHQWVHHIPTLVSTHHTSRHISCPHQGLRSQPRK